MSYTVPAENSVPMTKHCMNHVINTIIYCKEKQYKGTPNLFPQTYMHTTHTHIHTHYNTHRDSSSSSYMTFHVQHQTFLPYKAPRPRCSTDQESTGVNSYPKLNNDYFMTIIMTIIHQTASATHFELCRVFPLTKNLT